MAAAADVHLRERGVAGLRDTRNPAAQRIHLLQVLMSAPAKNLIWFVAVGLTAALLIAAFNFVVDPLQLFGRFQLRRHWYSPDSRMQDAGLIRTQHFDTVFMDTSLAVHFRQSEIDKELDVKSVKLAMSGSTSVE